MAERAASIRAGALAVALLAAAVGVVALGATPSGAATVDVVVADSAFQDATTTVRVGDTVRWTVAGSLPHTVTADGGSFGSGTLGAGDVFTHTFTEPGVYPYHCLFHGASGGVGMSGAVIVEEPGPFTDVPAGHPFAGDITWLVDEGVTSGFPDGSFRPTEPVSRQSMAAFLFRFAGVGEGPGCGGSFPDVGPGDPFCQEITWLVDQGVTSGFPDGTFRPTQPVSRQSMAAFLHRFASP